MTALDGSPVEPAAGTVFRMRELLDEAVARLGSRYGGVMPDLHTMLVELAPWLAERDARVRDEVLREVEESVRSKADSLSGQMPYERGFVDGLNCAARAIAIRRLAPTDAMTPEQERT